MQATCTNRYLLYYCCIFLIKQVPYQHCKLYTRAACGEKLKLCVAKLTTGDGSYAET